jgi:hypothetical protein
VLLGQPNSGGIVKGRKKLRSGYKEKKYALKLFQRNRFLQRNHILVFLVILESRRENVV